MIYLTPHFTLDELAATAHRNVDNRPTPEDLTRLKALCQALEIVRDRWGPLRVTSGYRSKALHNAIYSSLGDAAIKKPARSAHLYGCAADFVPLRRGATVDAVAVWIAHESKLRFDQVIREENKNGDVWVHLGLAPPFIRTPRRQLFKMTNYRRVPWPLEEL